MKLSWCDGNIDEYNVPAQLKRGWSVWQNIGNRCGWNVDMCLAERREPVRLEHGWSYSVAGTWWIPMWSVRKCCGRNVVDHIVAERKDLGIVSLTTKRKDPLTFPQIRCTVLTAGSLLAVYGEIQRDYSWLLNYSFWGIFIFFVSSFPLIKSCMMTSVVSKGGKKVLGGVSMP